MAMAMAAAGRWLGVVAVPPDGRLCFRRRSVGCCDGWKWDLWNDIVADFFFFGARGNGLKDRPTPFIWEWRSVGLSLDI